MLQKINSKSKKIIFGILFSVLVLIFLGLLFFSRDSKIIKDINEFIKTDTKVLYISDGNKDSIVGDTAPLPPPLNSPLRYFSVISFKTDTFRWLLSNS